MARIKKVKPATYAIISSLAYAICWYLYMIWVSPYAMRSVDPCSATPGIDYTWFWLILIGHLLLFGTWLYRDLRLRLPWPNLIFTMILMLFILPIAFAFLTASILYEYEQLLTSQSQTLGNLIYKRGCYQDLEVHEEAVFILVASMLCAIHYLFKRRPTK